MSHELINHNSDLQRLLNEGYNMEIFENYLIIYKVPYVNNKKEIKYGTLISESDLTGHCIKPTNHVALWVGDFPCDDNGSQLDKLVIGDGQNKIIKELTINHTFSQKPTLGAYTNYHEKMTTYIRILESQVHVLNSAVTAKTFCGTKSTKEESIFCYSDTASNRAGIVSVNEKLKQDKIAIIGLGGTGSYVLDLVAKTPVKEIHLFDDDLFHNHNAFRSPGAPSHDELLKKISKVQWFKGIYSHMRKKIISHQQSINKSNIIILNSMNVVFLCIDNGTSRKIITDYLIENKILFIDVGIGLLNEDGSLTGSIRITTCTPSLHNHAKNRIPFNDDDNNEYSNNIQVSDMNALNASLAVIKWKKIRGFYHNLSNEHNTVYGVTTNTITNDVISHEV